MSKGKKKFLIILFLLIDTLLLATYISIKNYTSLAGLKNEVLSLTKLEIGKDRYNTKIKTRGNYAVVEEAIKEYLDNNAVLLQDTFSILNDKNLTSILSYDNYANDGPLFQKSLTYLDTTQKDFNEKVKKFSDNLEEDNIIKYIETKTEDEHSKKLYKELILTPELKKKYDDTKTLADKSRTKVNHVIDVSRQVLTFLVNANGSWKVEEGEIKFNSQALYDQYALYLNELKQDK